MRGRGGEAERRREAHGTIMSDHGYARAHVERKRQQQQRKTTPMASQRQRGQRAPTLEPNAGRQQNYGAANKLRGMREEHASRESEYMKTKKIEFEFFEIPRTELEYDMRHSNIPYFILTLRRRCCVYCVIYIDTTV